MAHTSRRPRTAALSLALAAICGSCLLAQGAAAPPSLPSLRPDADRIAALRSSVVATFRRAQARSDRLGLDRPTTLTLARRTDPLRQQLGHWRIVSDFLAARRELGADERERTTAKLRRSGRAVGGVRRQVVGLHRRVVERSTQLGVSPPAPLRLAGETAPLERQRDHWRSVGDFLGARHELRRGDELTPRWDAWMCVHSHEGAWTASTGNGYYGGLQMDYSFMRTYGGELLAQKGTADNWTPTEQVMVADRAWRTRGFPPWPNTARFCGLI